MLDTFMQYFVPSAIAAGAVVVSQVLATRREERRVAAERQHAFRQRWIDERRDAATSFLAAVDKAIRAGDSWVQQQEAGTPSLASLKALHGTMLESIEEPLAALVLVASDPTVAVADTIHRHLLHFTADATATEHGHPKVALDPSVRDPLAAAKAQRRSFLAAARRDLGTDQ